MHARRVSVQLPALKESMASDNLDSDVNKEEDLLERACVYLLLQYFLVLPSLLYSTIYFILVYVVLGSTLVIELQTHETVTIMLLSM